VGLLGTPVLTAREAGVRLVVACILGLEAALPHSYTNLLTHVVFGTKRRAGLIDDELKPRLHPYMAGILKHLDGRILIVNGIVEMSPTFCES